MIFLKVDQDDLYIYLCIEHNPPAIDKYLWNAFC